MFVRCNGGDFDRMGEFDVEEVVVVGDNVGGGDFGFDDFFFIFEFVEKFKFVICKEEWFKKWVEKEKEEKVSKVVKV